MTKIMLFVFLLSPDGSIELGDTGNGHPFREYQSVEECEANARQRSFMPSDDRLAFLCLETREFLV